MRPGRPWSYPQARLRPVGKHLVAARDRRMDVGVAGAQILRLGHVDRGDVVADPVEVLDVAGPLRPADGAAKGAAHHQCGDEREASPEASQRHELSPIRPSGYMLPQMQ